jgi:hypothetical protein
MKTYLWHFIVLVLLSCQDSSSEIEIYMSSAEPIDDTIIPAYDGQSITAEKIVNTSRELSRTGSHSVKLDSFFEYGFKTTVNELQKGEFVQASIWQHQSFPLNAFYGKIKSNNGSELLFRNTLNETGSEWFKQTYEVYIENDHTSVDFYVYSGGKEAYFDDIYVSRHHKIPQVDSGIMNSLVALEIDLPEETVKSLELFKQKALEKGVIGESEKQILPAFLIDKNDSIPIEIRLKGDWTDHLNFGKISYRIKLKEGNMFMGMRTFSIQHPKTRNYMHEWWMHQLFEKEGLLSTKYEFIPVFINSTYKGIYAIEEHFEKELIKARERPTGPILKMDETGLWEHTYLKTLNPKLEKYPIFESAVIVPFKKNKTLKNVKLRKAFLKGQSLLKMYNDLHERPEDIFDLDQLAKYYAIQELGNIQHAHQWHNNRFYFNPITQKLELIGFDMNAGHKVEEDLYIVKKLLSNPGPKAWMRIVPLLKNQEFKYKYLKYLKVYSDPLFISNCLKFLESKIHLNEKLLSMEIESYNFDEKYYIERAKKIQKDLARIDSIWSDFLHKNVTVSEMINEQNFTTENKPLLVLNASLNAYLQSIQKNVWLLKLENYHLNTIYVLGYTTNEKKEVYFDEPITMKQFTAKYKQSTSYHTLTEKPEYVFFKAKNVPNKVFKKTIMNW